MRDRVFVLPGDSDLDRRIVVFALEGTRDVIGDGCADVQCRLYRRIYLGIPVRALVAALYCHARLHALCVVPHRVRFTGAGNVVFGNRGLVSALAETQHWRGFRTEMP